MQNRLGTEQTTENVDIINLLSLIYDYDWSMSVAVGAKRLLAVAKTPIFCAFFR